MGKPGINGLFIRKLNFCVLFNYYLFLYSSHYLPANHLTYQRYCHIEINLLSVLIYFIKLSLMKFQLCYNLISFLVLQVVIECPEKVLKKLLSVTVCLQTILENTFHKSQLYDKLVTMLLSYHFFVTFLCKTFSTSVHASPSV